MTLNPENLRENANLFILCPQTLGRVSAKVSGLLCLSLSTVLRLWIPYMEINGDGYTGSGHVINQDHHLHPTLPLVHLVSTTRNTREGSTKL